MTDREKLTTIKAEIEKRYEYWRKKEHTSHSIESEIRMSECQHLLLMLDSLQEELVSDDLNKAAIAYNKKVNFVVTGNIPNEHFIAGAKWQKARNQETTETAIHHAYHNGRLEMKEQMMAKSIEAVVSQVPCSNEIILYNPSSVDKYYLPQEMNKLGLNKGDKVKLVIIKEG